MFFVAIREMVPRLHVMAPGKAPQRGLSRTLARARMGDFDVVDRYAVSLAPLVDEIAKENDAI